MDRHRLETILAGLLAAVFAVSGAVKFANYEMAAANFRGWGYPGWMALVVGAVELAGTAGVLLGRREVLGASLRFWAASLLAALMAGAVATHVVHREPGMLALAAGLLAAASGLAYVTLPDRLRPGEPVPS